MAVSQRWLYNLSLATVSKVNDIIAPLLNDKSDSKTVRFLKGRLNLLELIENGIHLDSSKATIWIHAASLGEFAIARPIIDALGCAFNIVITFFSPSGYDAVSNDSRRYSNVYYLPWDTPKNAVTFLNIAKPAAALFMVSEYWHNYLGELKRRNIPTFLVSAIIRNDSVFFKNYGAVYRESLKSFTTIFALDRNTITNLHTLGYDSAELAGDPLFDNAYNIARQPYHDKIIERFKGADKLFIAGSVSDTKDLELVSALANEFRDVKFLIVPHTISKEKLEDIVYHLDGKAELYSDCDQSTDFTGTQTLIIDFIGALSKIYRYGTWAYIGGGFTPFLHSVIEATVYGLPVAFGPEIKRKITPMQMIDLGIGSKITDYAQLKDWFLSLRDDEIKLTSIKDTALRYVEDSLGSTDKIVEKVISAING